MPPEQWTVTGADKHGEAFSASFYVESLALRVARRINSRGGNVTIERLVWNGPAAAYRPPREDS